MCHPSFWSKGSSGSVPEGEPQFWNLHGLWPASPTDVLGCSSAREYVGTKFVLV
jgi:ribonuclease I